MQRKDIDFKKEMVYIDKVKICGRLQTIHRALLQRESLDTAGLCNGSTADSDSVCEGSNPSPAAKGKSLESTAFAMLSGLLCFLLAKLVTSVFFIGFGGL